MKLNGKDMTKSQLKSHLRDLYETKRYLKDQIYSEKFKISEKEFNDNKALAIGFTNENIKATKNELKLK